MNNKFLNLRDIEKENISDLKKLYFDYYENGFYKLLDFVNLDIAYKSAKGTKVYDYEGNEYTDFLSSFGCMSLGHNDKRILDSLVKYSSEPNILQGSISIFNGILANNLAFLTDYNLTKCHFTNCGTEAVEEALKLAFMYKNKGDIIYFENSYHGKTIGSLSALGSKVKKNYETLERNFHEAKYDDIEDVMKIIEKHKIAAIILEPIQGEGGINIPHKSFLKNIRKICDKENILMILDEIQTGLGRCGEIFCYKIFDVIPDILCVSKTLSGGYIPIGAVMTKNNIWQKTYGKMKNGELITTTFSGNKMACIAAIEALTIIREDNLCDRVKNIGYYAVKELLKLKKKHKIITKVQGIGLLIGIEFKGLEILQSDNLIKLNMGTIISKLLNEYKIITQVTENCPYVLRFEPPFTISKEEIDYFIRSLDKVLNSESGLLKLCLHTTYNAMKELN